MVHTAATNHERLSQAVVMSQMHALMAVGQVTPSTLAEVKISRTPCSAQRHLIHSPVLHIYFGCPSIIT